MKVNVVAIGAWLLTATGLSHGRNTEACQSARGNNETTAVMSAAGK